MHLFQSFCAKLPTSNDMDHGVVRHPDWYQDSLANSFFCHRNSCARNDVSNTLPKSGLISRIVTERWCCAVCHDLCSVNRIVCHRIGWGSRCDRRSESLCILYIVELLLVYGRLWQVCPSISNVLSALSVSEAGLRSNDAKPKVPSRSGFAWHWWFQVNPGNRGNRDRAPAPIPGHRGNTAGRWGWSGWWAQKFTEHLHVQHVRFKEQTAHMASRGVQMGHLNWTSCRSHWNILELCVVCKAKV